MPTYAIIAKSKVKSVGPNLANFKEKDSDGPIENHLYGGNKVLQSVL